MLRSPLSSPLRSPLSSPLAARRGGGAPSFDPATLFASGEQGGWYDPSDFSTMFQDTAGTVPVTAVGQAVARINDKSGRGNHLTQSVLAARPLLQQDANGNYYLDFDGVDDVLFGTASDQLIGPWDFYCGANITTGNALLTGLFSKTAAANSGSTNTNVEGIFQRSDGSQRVLYAASRTQTGSNFNATLNSAFVIGSPFVARASAQATQLRIETGAGFSVASVDYTGTVGSTAFRIGHSVASCGFRFYSGLAIDRLLSSEENTSLMTHINNKMGL